MDLELVSVARLLFVAAASPGLARAVTDVRFRCPLYENAYSPESMSNRVSRYPFPDHHPPPLPLLPLAVREMTAWLEGDKERVAIIHCKAGKVCASRRPANDKTYEWLFVGSLWHLIMLLLALFIRATTSTPAG